MAPHLSKLFTEVWTSQDAGARRVPSALPLLSSPLLAASAFFTVLAPGFLISSPRQKRSPALLSLWFSSSELSTLFCPSHICTNSILLALHCGHHAWKLDTERMICYLPALIPKEKLSCRRRTPSPKAPALRGALLGLPPPSAPPHGFSLSSPSTETGEYTVPFLSRPFLWFGAHDCSP